MDAGSRIVKINTQAIKFENKKIPAMNQERSHWHENQSYAN